MKGQGALFTDIAYEIGVVPLIQDGFLAPLVPKQVEGQIDTSEVRTRAGEFAAGELEAAALDPQTVRTAVEEILRHGGSRRSWLVFTCGLEHARAVADELSRRAITNAVVTGKTPEAERDRAIADYRAGNLQALVNVNVLTTGFDAPETDLLAVLRPTKSRGLYVQMMGRGMRVAPGKEDCLVVDFGANVYRHGPINRLREDRARSRCKNKVPAAKACPACGTLVAIDEEACWTCGYRFQRGEEEPCQRRLSRTAGDLRIIDMGGEALPGEEVLEVESVQYARHRKPGRSDSLRVTYHSRGRRISEWICLEHRGYAEIKARRWWERRDPGGRPPSTVTEALGRARDLLVPARIVISTAERFARVVGYDLGREPEGVA